MKQELFCEVCGKRSQKLYKVLIEGTIVNVCKDCKSLGKQVKEQKTKNSKTLAYKHTTLKPEIEEYVIEGYGRIIEQAIKEKYGSIKRFAEKAKIKEKYLVHVIHEELTPTISEAKRFEKLLGIKLVEKEVLDEQESEVEEQEKEKQTITLEDKIDPKLKKLLGIE